MTRRDIDVDKYYQAMKTLKTSGLDIMVLILSHLLKVKTLILIRDFLWKSVEGDVNDFDVFLMLFTSGRFVSASPRNKSKLEMEVPVFARTLIQPSPINVVIGSVPNLPVDTSVKYTKQNIKKEETMAMTTDHFGGTSLQMFYKNELRFLLSFASYCM